MLVLIQLIKLLQSRGLSTSEFQAYLADSIATLTEDFTIDSMVCEIENLHGVDLSEFQRERLSIVLLNGKYKSAFALTKAA